MGTSSSHAGPGDGPGLLPSWASDDAGVPAGDGGDADGNGSTNGDGEQDDGTATDADSASSPVLPEIAPGRNWQSAKSSMTRFATSGGGSGRLGSAGSAYVRARGGARRATTSATSGRTASRQVSGFLSSVARSGVQQALDSIGLRHVVGQSSDQVLARLVDALAPAGATKEEAAARRAIIEVLEFLYETVIGEDGDLTALDNMDADTVEEAIERSISGYVYHRWLDDLGLSIEKGAVTEVAAIRLEREIKEYVDSCVSLELDQRSVLDINWSGPEGRQIIDRVYRDAYALLEAGS